MKDLSKIEKTAQSSKGKKGAVSYSKTYRRYKRAYKRIRSKHSSWLGLSHDDKAAKEEASKYYRQSARKDPKRPFIERAARRAYKDVYEDDPKYPAKSMNVPNAQQTKTKDTSNKGGGNKGGDKKDRTKDKLAQLSARIAGLKGQVNLSHIKGEPKLKALDNFNRLLTAPRTGEGKDIKSSYGDFRTFTSMLDELHEKGFVDDIKVSDPAANMQMNPQVQKQVKKTTDVNEEKKGGEHGGHEGSFLTELATTFGMSAGLGIVSSVAVRGLTNPKFLGSMAKLMSKSGMGEKVAKSIGKGAGGIVSSVMMGVQIYSMWDSKKSFGENMAKVGLEATGAGTAYKGAKEMYKGDQIIGQYSGQVGVLALGNTTAANIMATQKASPSMTLLGDAMVIDGLANLVTGIGTMIEFVSDICFVLAVALAIIGAIVSIFFGGAGAPLLALVPTLIDTGNALMEVAEGFFGAGSFLQPWARSFFVLAWWLAIGDPRKEALTSYYMYDALKTFATGYAGSAGGSAGGKVGNIGKKRPVFHSESEPKKGYQKERNKAGNARAKAIKDSTPDIQAKLKALGYDVDAKTIRHFLGKKGKISEIKAYASKPSNFKRKHMTKMKPIHGIVSKQDVSAPMIAELGHHLSEKIVGEGGEGRKGVGIPEGIHIPEGFKGEYPMPSLTDLDSLAAQVSGKLAKKRAFASSLTQGYVGRETGFKQSGRRVNEIIAERKAKHKEVLGLDQLNNKLVDDWHSLEQGHSNLDAMNADLQATSGQLVALEGQVLQKQQAHQQMSAQHKSAQGQVGSGSQKVGGLMDQITKWLSGKVIGALNRKEAKEDTDGVGDGKSGMSSAKDFAGSKGDVQDKLAGKPAGEVVTKEGTAIQQTHGLVKKNKAQAAALQAKIAADKEKVLKAKVTDLELLKKTQTERNKAIQRQKALEGEYVITMDEMSNVTTDWNEGREGLLKTYEEEGRLIVFQKMVEDGKIKELIGLAHEAEEEEKKKEGEHKKEGTEHKKEDASHDTEAGDSSEDDAITNTKRAALEDPGYYIPEGDKAIAKEGADIKKGALGYEDVTGQPIVHGVSPADIGQGFIGDCYFMAALATVAKKSPHILESGIKPNKAGLKIYSVRLFKKKADGSYKPVWISVDVDVPKYKASTGPLYAKQGEGHGKEPMEIWPILYEKAYAVFRIRERGQGGHYGYDTIGHGGFPEKEALPFLTGKDATENTKGTGFSSNDAANLWTRLMSAEKHHKPATAWSTLNTITKKMENEDALYRLHVYSILKVWEAGNKRMMQIRNPHRNKGKKYGDEFQMSFKDFVKYFNHLEIGS